jgi:L-arabinokinase
VPPGVVFVAEADFIDSGFRYEDLVAAVDVVVTKPGYGIISECISANRPMLYTSRGQFREYDVLVREMPRYLRCRFIDQRTLMQGNWSDATGALRAQAAPPGRMDLNGADVAANALSDLLDASR